MNFHSTNPKNSVTSTNGCYESHEGSNEFFGFKVEGFGLKVRPVGRSYR